MRGVEDRNEWIHFSTLLISSEGRGGGADGSKGSFFDDVL